MPDNETQKQIERETFIEFAEHSGVGFDVSSVKQEPPPKPDIQCLVNGNGWIGFELVGLTNERFNKLLDLNLRYGRALREEKQKRPELVKRYNDALIVLLFKDDERSGLAHIPIIMQLLEFMPENYEGDVLTCAKKFPDGKTIVEKIKGKISELSVERLKEKNGPYFYTRDMELVDSTRVKNRIKGKFTKPYDKCGLEWLELLAYFPSWHPPPDPDQWVEELSDFVKREIENSPFKKVWVFDQGSKNVLFS